MSEATERTIKRGAQAVLAGGGIVYGLMVPAYFFEIFEQKNTAQAAYQRLEREQVRARSELREDMIRAVDVIEKKLDRIEWKLDKLRR